MKFNLFVPNQKYEIQEDVWVAGHPTNNANSTYQALLDAGEAEGFVYNEEHKFWSGWAGNGSKLLLKKGDIIRFQNYDVRPSKHPITLEIVETSRPALQKKPFGNFIFTFVTNFDCINQLEVELPSLKEKTKKIVEYNSIAKTPLSSNKVFPTYYSMRKRTTFWAVYEDKSDSSKNYQIMMGPRQYSDLTTNVTVARDKNNQKTATVPTIGFIYPIPDNDQKIRSLIGKQDLYTKTKGNAVYLYDAWDLKEAKLFMKRAMEKYGSFIDGFFPLSNAEGHIHQFEYVPIHVILGLGLIDEKPNIHQRSAPIGTSNPFVMPFANGVLSFHNNIVKKREENIGE